jgi:hypothetical protein
MNRIKIIKRANLQLPREMRETEAKKVNVPGIGREAAQVVENWIDEWRRQNLIDARRAFADLFRRSSLAIV